MLSHRPDATEPSTDLERLARRAQRNLMFQRRIHPEPITQPGQLERACARIRRVIKQRATA